MFGVVLAASFCGCLLSSVFFIVLVALVNKRRADKAKRRVDKLKKRVGV